MKTTIVPNTSKISLCMFIFGSIQVSACDIYMQMEKESNGYRVMQVNNVPINKPNVLMTSYDDGKWSNQMKAAGECSGDFANKPFSKSYAAFMLTMGFMGSKTPNGSKCEIYESEIALAAASSNYKADPAVLKLTNMCIQIESDEKERKKQFDAENEKFQIKLQNLEIARRQREKAYEQQFRDSLKQGMQTNCGTLVDMKGVMAYVQTGGDAGAIWIRKDYLAPEREFNNGSYIKCQDDNRIYRLENGSWVVIKR